MQEGAHLTLLPYYLTYLRYLYLTYLTLLTLLTLPYLPYDPPTLICTKCWQAKCPVLLSYLVTYNFASLLRTTNFYFSYPIGSALPDLAQLDLRPHTINQILLKRSIKKSLPPKRSLSMTSFDITKARGQFPALNEPQIYFDNAGGSQTLGTVIDSYVSQHHLQGWTYPDSMQYHQLLIQNQCADGIGLQCWSEVPVPLRCRIWSSRQVYQCFDLWNRYDKKMPVLIDTLK